MPAHKPELQSKVHVEYVKADDAEALNVCECKVCYDMPVRTVFVNCGHIDPALLRFLRWSLHLKARCASPCLYDLEFAGLESTKRQGTPMHWEFTSCLFFGGRDQFGMLHAMCLRAGAEGASVPYLPGTCRRS